jgi:hypothetical protein
LVDGINNVKIPNKLLLSTRINYFY